MQPPPIRDLLGAFRGRRPPRAGSLIITLFGDAVLPRGGRIWLGSLIRLLQPLEVSERLVRTSVFRLARDGWLLAQSQGRRADYVLSDTGRRRFDEAARRIYASAAPVWDRRWRLILTVDDLPPKARERTRAALSWKGFGALGGDCFVHPGADIDAAVDALVAEGLGEHLGALMPLLAAEAGAGLGASNAQLVRRAWNLHQLGTEYEDFVSTFGPLRDALRSDASQGVDAEDAFLLRLLLIHEYRRLLLRDPELPDVLLPPEWPGQQARLLCKDLYRRVWAPSERHLDRHVQLASGQTPAADPARAQRFADADPLQPTGAAP